jgi:hypothetical protein
MASGQSPLGAADDDELLPPSPDEAGFDSPEDEDEEAPDDDDEPPSVDPPDELPDELPDEPLDALLDALFAALVRDDAPRSFLAQPDPLKWIVGDENCLRIVPSRPHAGQKTGPWSLIPWRMSARWSQEVQRYS